MRLGSDSCTNANGSHNKLLHKSISGDAQSIINQSERVVINLWKEKWKDTFNKYSNNEAINHLLNNDIIPHIASYGIKKE